MARYNGANWNLDAQPTWDQAQLAVLMDIRDELQQLNALLHCGNFINIPNILREIRANTTKKRRERKAKAA